MSKRYEITGRTNSPLDPFPDFGVGAVVEGDLDEQVEQQLIGAGALRVVPDEPAAEPEAKAAEPEAPQLKPATRGARRTGRPYGTDQPTS